MELLDALLAALIVVLAAVVVAATAPAPNKQGLAFKAGNYDALSLYLGYGTNLVGMKVWLWQASSNSWHSATKEVKDKFGIVSWTYGRFANFGTQGLELRCWALGGQKLKKPSWALVKLGLAFFDLSQMILWLNYLRFHLDHQCCLEAL